MCCFAHIEFSLWTCYRVAGAGHATGKHHETFLSLIVHLIVELYCLTFAFTFQVELYPLYSNVIQYIFQYYPILLDSRNKYKWYPYIPKVWSNVSLHTVATLWSSPPETLPGREAWRCTSAGAHVCQPAGFGDGMWGLTSKIWKEDEIRPLNTKNHYNMQRSIENP